MVSGSGQQNRDEELFGHKPFAVLADALARQGIASLRYDDRGWGDASVRFYEFTTADFYADALSGLALLRKQFDRVGMLGHSEGGTIALMAAAEGKTDFIVTLAAMAVSGKETMIAQNRSVLTAAGTTPEMTEAYCMAIGCALDQLAQGKKTADIKPTGVPVLFRSVFDKALKQGDSPYIRHLLNVDWKDYRHNSVHKQNTMHAVKFLHLFSMHILPPAFVRIRHYGLLSPSNRDKVRKAQAQLGGKPVPKMRTRKS